MLLIYGIHIDTIVQMFHYFICVLALQLVHVVTSDDPFARCPPSVVRNSHLFVYKDVCIELNHDEHDWDDARGHCIKNGGDLVVIRDQTKQTFIVNALKQTHWDKNGIWIGGTDRDREGQWKWITGERFMWNDWGNGEGSKRSGFLFSSASWEDCALIRLSNGYKWEDFPCKGPFYHYSSICEYAMLPVMSTQKPTSTLKYKTTTLTPSTTLRPTTTFQTQSTSTNLPTTTKAPASPTTLPATTKTTTNQTVAPTTTRLSTAQTTKMTPAPPTTTTTPSPPTTKKPVSPTTRTPAPPTKRTSLLPTTRSPASPTNTNTPASPTTTRTPASPTTRTPALPTTRKPTPPTTTRTPASPTTRKPAPPTTHAPPKPTTKTTKQITTTKTEAPSHITTKQATKMKTSAVTVKPETPSPRTTPTTRKASTMKIVTTSVKTSRIQTAASTTQRPPSKMVSVKPSIASSAQVPGSDSKTPVTKTSATNKKPTANSLGETQHPSKGKSYTGYIIGAVVTAVVAAGLLVVIIVIRRRRRASNRTSTSLENPTYSAMYGQNPSDLAETDPVFDASNLKLHFGESLS